MEDDPITTDEEWILESQQQDSYSTDHHISEVEYTRLTDQFHRAGYREGVLNGKQLSIQEAFDSGFQAGANQAKRVGLLRGRASATLDLLLRQTEEDDARIDRIRNLIRELNQHACFQDSTFTNVDQDQIEGLANQWNRSMDLSSHSSRSCQSNPVLSTNSKLEDTQSTLDHCRFELDAILATMNILISSP